MSMSVRRLLPAIIFLIAFAAFFPALQAGFINWDDGPNIVGNSQYRGFSPSHLKWMFTSFMVGHYQPLTWMTHAFDYLLWGLNAPGHHFTNLLLHATSAMLLYFLILALLRAAGRPDDLSSTWAAAAGALFFAIHPLRVESVAWITERRDVLSGVFFLLTILVYLRMARETGRRRAGWYALSLACFALSLLSKAWGMTLPAVLLVLDAYPLRRFRAPDRTRVILEKVPYAVLALAAGIAAYHAQKQSGAMTSLADFPLIQRLAQGAYGLWFYPWKTVAPLSLSPLYVLDFSPMPTDARYPVCAVLTVGVTIALFVVRRRWPALLASWVCYAVIVSPVLGLAQSGQQSVADRYSYLSCLPWAILVAAGMLSLFSRHEKAALGGAGVALAALAVLTVAQTAVWRDSLTLWRHAAKLDPTSSVALANLGEAQYESRDLADAVRNFDEAIRLSPRLAQAYDGRGRSRYGLGDLKGAIADFDACIDINPKHRGVFTHRGLAKVAAADLPGASADFEEALRRDARDAEAYGNRALVKRAAGSVRDAIADLDRAIELDPYGTGFFLTERGLTRLQLGDEPGAMVDFDAALRMNPRDLRAVRQRARGRAQRGDLNGALADCDVWIALAPEAVDAWFNRGQLRQALGDPESAIADYRRALQLAPPDWPQRRYLEAMLTGGGRRP